MSERDIYPDDELTTNEEVDIIIHAEFPNSTALNSLLDALENIVPYMADNVVITSEIS